MDEATIKDKVEDLLKKNPLLKPLQLCRILQLDYEKHGNYVTVLRSKWRTLAKIELGSKSLKFHHWHGYVYVPKECSREQAIDSSTWIDRGKGRVNRWIKTKSKNRFLLWKSPLGRLMWFETGRVNVWIRKPANKGKAAQILANAFFKTYLIPDIRIFEKFLASLRFKGASVTIDLGFKLPYTKISFLKKSNGVEITLGDLSDPTCIEIDYHYPLWAEKNEELLQFFRSLFSPPDKMIPDRRKGYTA